MRKGFSHPEKFQLERDSIKIKSVTFKLLDDVYGYVRIGEFQEQTGKDLEAAQSRSFNNRRRAISRALCST